MQESRRWRVGVVYLLIVCVASFLRLYRLDLIDLRYDEALAPLQALNITHGEWLLVAPFSGSVINHPPLFLYLLAIPYLFSTNIFVIAAFRVLLDVAAVVLCWQMCQRFFNARVAALASLLFAVAPWAIQSSRRLSIEALAIGSLIMIWGLLRVVRERDSRGWTVAGLGYVLSVGVHLSALPLGLVMLATALLHRDVFKTKRVLIGLLPLFILSAMYLANEAATGFANVNALLSRSDSPAFFTLDGLQKALWMSGGAHLSDLTGQDFPAWQAQMLDRLAWIDAMQMGLLLLAISALLVGLRTTGSRSPIAVVLLWWWVPVLAQTRVSQTVQLHYFTTAYPAPFILMALFVDRAWQSSKPWRWVVSSLLAMIVLWQGATTLRFADFLDHHFTEGGYGTRLRDIWAARVDATANLPEGESLVAVIKGFPTPWQEQAVVLRVVLAGVPYRFLNSDDDGFTFRSKETHYLYAPNSAANLSKLQNVFADMPDALAINRFATKADGTGYRHVWLHQPLGADGFAHQPNPVWASRVELVQYRVQAQPTSSHIGVVLHVLETPKEGVDYHWTFRLFNGQQQIAAKDIAGVHPSSWRADDLVYLTVDLPTPTDAPKATVLRMGSYTYPEVKSVMVSIPGQPAEESVTLPILP